MNATIIRSCFEHRASLVYNFSFKLDAIVRMHLQNLLSDVDSVNVTVGFEVVEGEAEAHIAVFIVTHLERFAIVLCCCFVLFVHLLDEAHELLCFHIRLVELNNLLEFLFCQVELLN